jgi:hypothetical protein
MLYTASGIIYARATPANLTVAYSATGGREVDITDRLNPPTLAAGTITCVPVSGAGTFDGYTTSGGVTTIAGDSTTFLSNYVVGQVLYYIDTFGKYVLVGTIASIASNVSLKLTGVIVNVPTVGDTLAGTSNIVAGVGTDFISDFQDKQYLFAYDYNGAPFLVGRILSRDSVSQITLTGPSSSAVAIEAQCGGMDTLLRQDDSILIRIPTIVENGNTLIPNWNSLRLSGNNPLQYNDPAKTSLYEYSVIGDVLSISTGTPSDADFTITPTNTISRYKSNVGPTGQSVFQNASDIPSYVFALYNPFAPYPTTLGPSTMYKLFTNERMEGIPVSVGMSEYGLVIAGYNVVG